MATQYFISNTLLNIPLNILCRLSETNIFIPYYHMVSDDEKLHIKHLYPHKNIRQFENDLDFILKRFTPIGLKDVLESLREGKTLPPRALHLTFDDGFRETQDIVAPILLKKGIPATFFLNSGFIDNTALCYQHKISILAEASLKTDFAPNAQNEIKKIFLKNKTEFKDIKTSLLSIKFHNRFILDEIAGIMSVDFSDYLLKNKPYLSAEQIKNLISKGFSIGAHSVDHPLYEKLSREEQIQQTMESIRSIKDNFSLAYGAFAFPHSDNGVSKHYFNQINKSNLVDISFGTAGLMEDIIPNNFQRFSLEKPLLPAENIIALQLAKKLWRMAKGKNRILRY